MVKLKNIKKNNFIVQCDIFPEDSQAAGHVSFDIESKKLIEYSLPEGYEWCRNHVNHAVDTLEKLSIGNELPEEKLVMWY